MRRRVRISICVPYAHSESLARRVGSPTGSVSSFQLQTSIDAALPRRTGMVVRAVLDY
jgi:hypothetical protein